MRYKERRRQEIKRKAEQAELAGQAGPDGAAPAHVFVERFADGTPKPVPGKRAAARPECVPLRFSDRTVRHVRVSKLERQLNYFAAELRITPAELTRLIAARRYVPGAAPAGVQARHPSWYVSDQYAPPAGLGLDF